MDINKLSHTSVSHGFSSWTTASGEQQDSADLAVQGYDGGRHSESRWDRCPATASCSRGQGPNVKLICPFRNVGHTKPQVEGRGTLETHRSSVFLSKPMKSMRRQKGPKSKCVALLLLAMKFEMWKYITALWSTNCPLFSIHQMCESRYALFKYCRKIKPTNFITTRLFWRHRKYWRKLMFCAMSKAYKSILHNSSCGW